MNSNSSPFTLVVGASTNPDRYSFKAIRALREQDIQVKAFGLKSGQVGDVSIETVLPTSAPDTITLYVGPERQAELIPKLIALKPRRIVFNPGTENPEFVRQAQLAGIETEMACTLVLLATHQY